MSGNSTTPCPTAIAAPARADRAPLPTTTTVRGPGAITPESDTRTAWMRNAP